MSAKISEKCRIAAKDPRTVAKRVAASLRSDKWKKAYEINFSKRAEGRARYPEKFSVDAGAGHVAAQSWFIVSPSNQVFQFKNLADFIRKNEDLFDADDRQWRYSKGRGGICRALQGISSIRPYSYKGNPKARVKGTWKGWRWCSRSEVLDSLPNNGLGATRTHEHS